MQRTDGSEDIADVAVVGAGTMGYGIALGFALGRRTVTLYDVDEGMLETARENVRSGIGTFVESDSHPITDAGSVLDRIAYETSLEAAVDGADLVTEAVPEQLDVKKEVMGDLDAYTPDDTILATNTSGLSITEIATAVADSGRVLGTHYFNPAHIVPVVEVVRGEETADWAVERTLGVFEALDHKAPVLVEQDIPGFVANRIQLAMAYEAESLLDRGIASAADIDRAVKGSFGFRLPVLGVFEKADHAGLDVHREVASYLLEDLDRGTEPHEVIGELVESGHYGLKTGRGFFDWRNRNPGDVFAERDERLLAQWGVYGG